ncbi:MAG: acyl carrier protein [Thermoanaerobaculia bacterium]
MTTEEIRVRVKEIIADVAGVDAAGIGDEAHFIEDLGLDSLAMLEMGVDIDYEFKLGVGDQRLAQLRSVPDTVALIEKCLAERDGESQVA